MREVVFHIVAVQVRYAERLLNMPVTEFEALAARLAEGKPGQGKPDEELFAMPMSRDGGDLPKQRDAKSSRLKLSS